MKRRLRIAVSVFFALVAVAFAALWVRTFFWMDSVSWPVRLSTARGNFYWDQTFNVPEGITDEWFQFGVLSMPLANRTLVPVGPPGLTIPFWAAILPIITLAISPWIARPWPRFSLRALLITATLVAVMLGLAVWASR